MDSQDLPQMPPTGEYQNDAEPEIHGWPTFWSVILGVGFVAHMTFAEIGDERTPGLYRRLRFFFVLLGGLGITGTALIVLTRMRKPRLKPPAAQDLA